MANFSNIKNSTIINKSFNRNNGVVNKNKKENNIELISKSDPHKLKSYIKNDNWEKAKTIATVLAFLTAVVGVITKIMDTW